VAGILVEWPGTLRAKTPAKSEPDKDAVRRRSAAVGARQMFPVGPLASRFVNGTAIALDLDGVLADTRPMWDAWLEDAARRARVELVVPEDREAAAVVLDEALGDWRPLLARFSADRAPLWIRPRADTNAALRRLRAGGVRIGVFTDAPRELAEIALAHAGAAREVDVVGTLTEVQAVLGHEVVVVGSRGQLGGLR